MFPCRIEDVPAYFRPILERIQQSLNADAVVEDYDHEWLHFHLTGMIDKYAIVAIESDNQNILIGQEQWTFQILCPLASAGEQGLWLHYLANPIAQAEYRAGAWFC